MDKIGKNGKFITVISGSEKCPAIIEELTKRFNINRFIYNSARGLTVVDSRLIGKFFYVEKGILNILLEDEIADDVFEFIYDYLDISNTPGSFIYMGELKSLTEFNVSPPKS